MYHKWKSYDVWFLRYETWQTEFFVILDHFLPLHPRPQQPTKSKVWKNERRACKYYHFTHVYHKWIWFLIYGAWRTDYFVTVGYFLPFYQLKPEKWKFGKMKKKQKPLEISSFYTNVSKALIICYTVPKIRCVTDIILIFYLGLFFALLPPKNSKHQNFRKMKKLPRDIIILHMFTTNNDDMIYGSWNMMRDGQTDRRTDRKSDI